MKELEETLALSIQGLNSKYDDDSDSRSRPGTQETDTTESSNLPSAEENTDFGEVERTDASSSHENDGQVLKRWKKFSPLSLKSPKSIALRHRRAGDTESIAALKTKYLERELEFLEQKNKREAEEHEMRMKILALRYDRLQNAPSEAELNIEDQM